MSKVNKGSVTDMSFAETSSSARQGTAFSDAAREIDPVLQGLIPPDSLETVLEAVRRSNRSVRVVMERLGLVSQKDWAEQVSAAMGLPLLSFDQFPRKLADDARLSPSFQQRKVFLLAEVSETAVDAVVADPFDTEMMRALDQLFGARLRLSVATERDIEAALRRTQDDQTAPDASSDLSLPGVPRSGEIDETALLELANDAPTIRFIETLFTDAMEARATDIHIEQQKDGMRIRFRIDGLLSVRPSPSPALERGIVSRLKILAGMDISEKRLPQDGSITQRIGGRPVDIRVATAPSVHGEVLVLRLLDTDAGLGSLKDLDMPPAVLKTFRHAAAQPNGLILMTGPTGSGKTTTLHAALGDINEIGRKIVTIENPVEINTPGLIQIEVKPDIGLTFASVLRTVLRHDPDVLMVGEIRDAETAELAVRAAMTGHLVFSTLHTNRAGEALSRLVDMGVPDYLLRSVIRLAAAQRLVRKLCSCARKADSSIGPAMITEIKAMARLTRDLPPVSKWHLRMAKGCEKCHGTGYRGRVAVFETLGAEQLQAGMGTAAQALAVDGMPRAAIELVSRGETTAEEVVRVFGLMSALTRGGRDARG